VRAFDLLPMLLLGLLGTAHCVAMCGPLVLAVAARSPRSSERERRERFLPSLLAQAAYHAGRVTTYVAIGALLGALSPALAAAARAGGADPARAMASVQLVLSLASAVLLVAFGLALFGLLRAPAGIDTSRLPGFSSARDGMLGGRPAATFAFGLLMGTLPCGLSWAAFSRAIGAGAPLPAALLVFAFALGTVPGLLLLGAGASQLVRRHRRLLDLLAALLLIFMGLRVGAKAVIALIG
jgi:sulfite exporter TauE/SafE